VEEEGRNRHPVAATNSSRDEVVVVVAKASRIAVVGVADEAAGVGRRINRSKIKRIFAFVDSRRH